MSSVAFILLASLSVGCTDDKEKSDRDFKLWLHTLPDDTYLDTSDWRRDGYTKHRTPNAADYSPDCSYVEDLLTRNMENGYLEIVISPELIKRSEEEIGHYVRVIFKVDTHPGDFVRLYQIGRDANDSSKILLKETPVHSPKSDFVDTGVFYDNKVEYFAQYLRRNGRELTSSRYYRYKPNWMWCMKDELNSRSVGKLFFPGSHDAGAYAHPKSRQNLHYFSRIYYNYVFTQEDSIYWQLMQGIRMLDLRISKYDDQKPVFYINHNAFKVHPLEDILDQIKEFTRTNPYEIIVLDIHHFPVGFTTQVDHDNLARYLKGQLGSLIYYHTEYPSWEVTLDEMWNTSGRIIVAYNDESASSRNNFYPGVDHLWGHKDDIHQLLKYMALNLPRACDQTVLQISCAMVELTPKGWGIFENRYKGLRNLASETNSVITSQFVVGSWGDAVQGAAVDFVSSTGIVTAAIRQNYDRTKPAHVCH